MINVARFVTSVVTNLRCAQRVCLKKESKVLQIGDRKPPPVTLLQRFGQFGQQAASIVGSILSASRNGDWVDIDEVLA